MLSILVMSLKQAFPVTFLSMLVRSLDSPLACEREECATLISTVISKYPERRDFLRIRLLARLLDAREEYAPFGLEKIFEVLDCLGGFSPYTEREVFWYILPLIAHRVFHLAVQPFANLLCKILNDSRELASKIFVYALRHFPFLNPKNHCPVFSIIKLTIARLDEVEFAENAALFTTYCARFMLDWNAEFAETVFEYWTGTSFQIRFSQLKKPSLSNVICSAVKRAAFEHWNPEIRERAKDVLGRFGTAVMVEDTFVPLGIGEFGEHGKMNSITFAKWVTIENLARDEEGMSAFPELWKT
jgi:hypothetical protein